MKSPSDILSHGLIEVSEKRSGYLREWRRERAIDKALRDGDDASPETPEGTTDAPELAKFARPFDTAIQAGDIRLLSSKLLTQERLAYVAVLEVNLREGYALVAPFSPYDNPACKDEWLTGLNASPLKVLQLWNAQPVPFFALYRSWRCCGFSEAKLETARALYACWVSGKWPTGELREQIGLAIHDPEDDRLVYQREEMSVFALLRTRLATWLATCDKVAAGVNDSKQPLFPVSLAAGDGSISAVGVVLDPTGKKIAEFTAILETEDASVSNWLAEKRFAVGAGGASVIAFAGNSGQVVAIGTATEDDDGTWLAFTEQAPEALARLHAGDVRFVIQEEMGHA